MGRGRRGEQGGGVWNGAGGGRLLEFMVFMTNITEEK